MEWWQSILSWLEAALYDLRTKVEQFYEGLIAGHDIEVVYSGVFVWLVSLLIFVFLFIRLRRGWSEKFSSLQREIDRLSGELDSERIWRKAAGENITRVTKDDLIELQRLIEVDRTSSAS